MSFALGAVLTIAGLAWWLSAMIFATLIAVGYLAKQSFESNRPHEPQPRYQPPPPPQPVPPANMQVQGLVLPSAQRDYRFLLDVTILWRLSGTQGVTHPRPDQLAIDAIRERATAFTERESPADSDVAAPRLATELSFPRPDRTGQMEVWAQGITLTIADDDRERLRRLAQIRKDEEVWDYERAYERSKRTYLREDVLSSTGSAVVWWLARDVTRVPEAVDLIGTLAKLVAAAQDREVEPIVQTFVNDMTNPTTTAPDETDFVDRLMAELLPNSSEPERADLADRLAAMATDVGATGLARTLRERFNAPDFTEPPEPDPDLFDGPVPETSGQVHPNGQPEAGPSDTQQSAPYTP